MLFHKKKEKKTPIRINFMRAIKILSLLIPTLPSLSLSLKKKIEEEGMKFRSTIVVSIGNAWAPIISRHDV